MCFLTSSIKVEMKDILVVWRNLSNLLWNNRDIKLFFYVNEIATQEEIIS